MQRERLGLDAVVRVDRAAAQPSLEEVDLRARHARSTACAGSRTARARPAPSQAKRSRPSSARPNGVCGEPRPHRDRERDAEPPSPVSSGARQRSSEGQTTAIRSGAVPAANEAEDLLRDELERRARARALEEANGALERRRLRGAVDE